MSVDTHPGPPLTADISRAGPRPRTQVRSDGGERAQPWTATSTRKVRLRRRGLRSPLTRRILILNVLALLIPVLGLLHLDQYRQSLVEAELDSLRVQGRAFSSTFASTAVTTSRVGQEHLLPEMTRQLMRVLLDDTGVRARIFSKSGELIADSFTLMGPGGEVQVADLPPPEGSASPTDVINHLYAIIVDWLPGQGDLPRYVQAAEQRAEDYEEVMGALVGESPGMVRIDRQGDLVLSLAVPIQRYRLVLGALLLSKDGSEINAAVRDRRLDILVVFAVALGVTVLLSLYLASTIGRPIRRLAAAADLVRFGKGRRYEIPDFTRRGDEIGDLSGAMREMTEALRSRLDAIEGFAADVAHEIKNPLTSLRSAVETVVRVGDPEQQKKLMSVILDDVGRLDRLISDISDASRLDAELSREETEPVHVAPLLEALVEVHEATAAERGIRVELDAAYDRDLMVPGIEGRLGQVFRNIINNAISFSPPKGVIRLSARRQGREVVITVSDEGPGIPEGKQQEIFNRFYSERPKGEKFGTHSGLGLSISKQIVEAHRGTLQAENRIDDEGRVTGARFVIRLPSY